jgi:hypothetical protein
LNVSPEYAEFFNYEGEFCDASQYGRLPQSRKEVDLLGGSRLKTCYKHSGVFEFGEIGTYCGIKIKVVK